MVSNRSSKEKRLLNKGFDTYLLPRSEQQPKGIQDHLESHKKQLFLLNKDTQYSSIQVNSYHDAPKKSNSNLFKTNEAEAQSNKHDIIPNNQNDKSNLNNLKNILTKQLKGKLRYSRTQSACHPTHSFKAEISDMQSQTINSQEDISDDEQQQQLSGKNKDINKLNEQMQAKTIHLEKRSVHEIPWKPLNKFRNFSFESSAVEGDQYDESKVHFIQTNMKKRHSFRPIFSAVLSSKGQINNQQATQLLHRDDNKHIIKPDGDIKSNDSAFVIENTFLMQQRSLFTNEILAQTHQDLLIKKPMSNSTQLYSSRIRFQNNYQNVLPQGRSSSLKQSAVYEAQKHIKKIHMHQNSIDLCYGSRESQCKDSEDLNRIAITQSQNSPFQTNVLSMQQDQLASTIQGFQTNPCPNTGGGIAKFRVLYKNNKKISIIKKNKIVNSSLDQYGDSSLTSKYLEKEKQNTEEIQLDNINNRMATTIITEGKRNNFLINSRQTSKNIREITPNTTQSQTIENNQNCNRNSNESTKNKSDSACDLFSQLNQSTQANSLHIKLNQTLQFTPDHQRQRITSFIFSQPKKKQE